MALVSICKLFLCLLRNVAEFVRRKQLMILDPRSPIIHGVVVVTVALLFLVVVWAEFPPDSPVAMVVVCMMLAHTALAVLMLHEKVCIRRVRWEEGMSWVAIDWLGCLAIQLVPDSVDHFLATVYLVWQISLLVWSLAANWNLFVEYYRRWQQSNSRFILESRPGDAGPEPSVAGATASV
jgi:hypothetical protein